jgi:hypothetical protein
VAIAAPHAERVVRLEEDWGREGNRAAAVATALRLIADLA